MKIDEMMGIIKSVHEVPAKELIQKLMNAIEGCNENVKRVFFCHESPAQYLQYHHDEAQGSLNELAVKYVTFLISMNTTRDFSKTVCNVSEASTDDWLRNNGATVGLWFMMDYLLYRLNLSAALDNQAESLSELVDNGTQTEFINGFMLECDKIGNYIPAILFLDLTDVLDPSGASSAAVTKVWMDHPKAKQVVEKDYKSFDWFSSFRDNFHQSGSVYANLKPLVDGALGAKYGPFKYKSREVIDCTPTGAPIMGYVTRYRYEYGKDAWNWIQSADGPAKYSMRSGKCPQNTESADPTPSGCVLKDTLIRMTDGSTKPVQDVKAGDEVLNGMGTVSVCSNEKIYNPYVKKTYGINDEKLRVTYEHALMTDRGWCSLDPDLTMQINPNVTVKQLEIGDCVWRYQGVEDGKLQIEKVPVQAIRFQDAGDECFEGYDLHFSEGYDSYFANDFLCLLCYPEVTTESILSNIKKNMSMAEQLQFWDMFRENEVLFRKVFGDASVDGLLMRL